MQTLSLIVLLWLVGACTTVGRTVVNEPDQPKAKDCQPLVFLSKSEIKADYQEMCVIQSRVANLPWSEGRRSDALSNSRELLCKCGADAVLIGNWTQDALFFQARFQMLGIRFVDSPGTRSGGRPFSHALAEYACEDEGGRWSKGTCRGTSGKKFVPRSRR